MKTKILEKFKALYGDGAVCYASPGRVNLIANTPTTTWLRDAGRHRQGDLCGG